MRNGILFLVGVFFILLYSPVMGQVQGDSLGLVGSKADTAIAERILNNAVEFIKKGKYEEAYQKAETAKIIYSDIFGTESKEVANALHQMGRSKYFHGEYEKSIGLYQESLNIRQSIWGDIHPSVAVSFNNLGIVYKDKSDFDKAILYANKALAIRIKIFGSLHPDVAWSYNNLGIAYGDKNELETSIYFHQLALDIRLKLFGNYHPDVAASYNNISVIYLDKGDYNKCMYYCEKALDINKKIFGSSHPMLAHIYTNIGNSYYGKGDYNLGIDYINQAITVLHEKYGELNPEIAGAYNNIGANYLSLGNYEKALYYHQKSFEIRSKHFGFYNQEVAQSCDNLGNTYGSIGDFSKASMFHQNALEINKKTLGPEHPNTAISYYNLAGDYLNQKEFSESIKNLKSAVSIFEKTYSFRVYLSKSHSMLGEIYEKTGDFGQAIIEYNYSLAANNYTPDLFINVISKIDLIRTLSLIGKTYLNKYIKENDNYRLHQSQYFTFQAISALDYQQLALTDVSRTHLQSKNYPIYEQAISVSLLKAGVDKNDTLRHNAFSYAEKSKASLLQAQIKATDAINFSGIPDSLLEKEHNLRIDISWREKQRQALLDKGLSDTDTNTLRISSIIFDLKNKYETLKQRFETEYPEYYRLKYDLSTVSLQYVQDTLLQPKNQALLEYFVGDSSIYLFVVRPDTLIVQEVKRDFPLEEWIEGLRQGIYGYYAAEKAIQTDSLKADAKRKYLEFAPKLYQKLVAPIAQHLPEKVILVPDGPLGYVPFDALLTAAPEDANNFKSYPYLIQKHQFSYTYSATLLREMRDKKHRQEPQKDFVAFAPFYNGDTSLLANMFAYDDLMRKDLQPLAFSGPEVAAASKLMHGETVAGTAATEEKFTNMASDYRIIHLATHGRADNRVGDYAFLAFTEIKDSLENELLYVKDLYNLQLNADLVVLSACETGIGKLQRGEGIISLARAFAYAGAKSIVTSLWSVNDKSTSELMRFFYRELQQGKDKDEALRLARLHFLKESSVRNAHPFFWAAFVPLGDMRPVR